MVDSNTLLDDPTAEQRLCIYSAVHQNSSDDTTLPSGGIRELMKWYSTINVLMETTAHCSHSIVKIHQRILLRRDRIKLRLFPVGSLGVVDNPTVNNDPIVNIVDSYLDQKTSSKSMQFSDETACLKGEDSSFNVMKNADSFELLFLQLYISNWNQPSPVEQTLDFSQLLV
ncbi:hypothetical protein QAD02_002550 [Eretmocerus hayati]|uniref:Uncharacterized protein n=1 Tax=Eretmocerus hayati TaxID=131215 RepID=A0ACC2NKZ9_9HYME|nr:hypothetical protein QAD02_002550 [Eretmocerus hayati]